VSTLTFVSTLGGAPVSGARVTVAGVAYTTNASGQISLTTPASAGVTIDASASGFIDRATVVRSESTISLWQVPAGVDSNRTTVARSMNQEAVASMVTPAEAGVVREI
jgi:hypothetical protein